MGIEVSISKGGGELKRQCLFERDTEKGKSEGGVEERVFVQERHRDREEGRGREVEQSVCVNET